MKNYQDMTDAEFAKFLKTATANQLAAAFCDGKSHAEIERDIRMAEEMGA